MDGWIIYINETIPMVTRSDGGGGEDILMGTLQDNRRGVCVYVFTVHLTAAAADDDYLVGGHSSLEELGNFLSLAL